MQDNGVQKRATQINESDKTDNANVAVNEVPENTIKKDEPQINELNQKARPRSG